MDTPPIGPTPTGPIPLGGPQIDPQSTTTDTLEQALLDVYSTILSASSEFRKTQYKSVQDQLKILLGIYQNLSQSAINQLNTASTNIDSALQAWNTVYDHMQIANQGVQSYQQSSQLAVNKMNSTIAYNNWQNIAQINSQVNSYKTGVQSAVDNLYSAINTYNQTNPSTSTSRSQLQSAISTYQSAISSLNSTYNSQLTNYRSITTDAIINNMNSYLTSLGLPNLSPPVAPGAISTASGIYAPPSSSSLPEPPINTPKPIVANDPNLSFSGVPNPPSISPQTTDLATAISQYQTAISDASQVYQSQIANFNTDRNAIINGTASVNTLLSTANMPVLSAPGAAPGAISTASEPYAPPSASPTYPKAFIPSVSLGSISNPIPSPLPLTQALALYLPNFSTSVSDTKLVSGGAARLVRNYLDTTDPYTGDVTLPSAYYKRQKGVKNPNVESYTPTVSLATVGIGTGSPVFQITLQRSLFDTLLNQQIKLSPDFEAKLQVVLGNALKSIRSSALASAIRQLPEGLIDQEKAPESLALLNGLALSNKIQAFVASGATDLIVANLLSEDPEFKKLSADDQAKLIKNIATEVNLALLGIAITQLAFSAGLPELTGQTLSKLTGLPFSEQNTQEANGINQTLQNPFVQTLLGNLLQDLLDQALASQKKIAKTIADNMRKAVEESLQSRKQFTSAEELKKAIKDALLKAKLNEEDAERIASRLANEVKTESELPPLDRKINTSPLQQVLDEVRTHPLSSTVSTETASTTVFNALPTLSGNFPTGSPQRFFIDGVIAGIQKNPNVATALENTVKENPATAREFRTSLLTNLAAQGISDQEANRIVSLAIKALTPEPKPTPETVSQIAEAANSEVTRSIQEELGPYRAKHIGTQVATSLNGIFSSYNAQLETLRQNDQEASLRQFSDSIGSLSNPSIPLFALATTLNPLIIDHNIRAYMTPAVLGELGQVDIEKMPREWRASTISPV